MTKLGLQTREERMTNLMKDIGKSDQLFWKKKNEIPTAYRTKKSIPDGLKNHS